jgi:hypothetical protein|nr:MAG TPA: hypothetical protein [Caudoviricetes sp.]
MSTIRKLNREVKKNKKELPMKKVVARKFGISNKELNRRFFKKEENERC